MTSIKMIIKNKPLKDGSYRVGLRLIKNRKKKVISLRITGPREHFDSHMERFRKGFPGYKKANQKIKRAQNYAEKVLEQLEVKGGNYSLEDFEQLFHGREDDSKSLWVFFDMKIQSALLKPKTRKAYQDTKRSLEKFHPGTLQPENITSQFLELYANHLRNKGSNDGGIRFFMRHLKAVLYLAHKNLKSKTYDNPFLDFSISRFKGQPGKRALTSAEMKSFKEVKLDARPDLIRSHDIAMFTFYCGGINFVDILTLRKENIVGQTLRYSRAKTGQSFVLELLPPTLDIINKYNNGDEGYIFPLLKEEDLTPEQFESRRHRYLSKYNKDLKEIAQLAGIKGNVTSYVLRHTYPTFLRNNAVSTDVISELMGHSDVRVTKAYLKEFPDEVINKAHRKLLDL